MDIHRCRFVPFPPQCINALAFSHESDPAKKAPKDIRLALGRSNGDIEIWNPHGGSWYQENIIRGGKNRSVESLVWTQEAQLQEENTSGHGSLRLFSIGDSPCITEWDLARSAPLRHVNGNFGDIWCFAVQPRPKPLSKDVAPNLPTSRLLAAGCQDGNIVLFSTEDNDLRFLKSIGKPPTKKPKVLSITWRDINTVVAGYEDSTIRVFDIRSRATLRTMSLGKPAEGNSTYVWTVGCLPDGSIISGDSSGELKIWDAKNYSLVQRLKSHQSDITDLTVSAHGDKIISVGVDRRTVIYQPISQQGQKKQRWTEVIHRRFHEHDVKAIVSFESKGFSVCVSGGVDTVPIVTPLQRWQSQYHRALPHLPRKPQMSYASQIGLLLTWWNSEMLIWRVPCLHASDVTVEEAVQSRESHQLVARIVLKDDENLVAATISADGKFVVASTIAETKLFQLRTITRGNSVEVRTRRVDLPPALQDFGGRAVAFSPDGHWICTVRLDNSACLVKLLAPVHPKDRPGFSGHVVKLTRKKRGSSAPSQLGEYQDITESIAFSCDGRILALADISGTIDLWYLEGHEERTLELAADVPGPERVYNDDGSSSEDSEDHSDGDDDDEIVIDGQRWIRGLHDASLPHLHSGVLALAFKPIDPQLNSSSVNGNIGLHATRHTPHPVAHELPIQHQKLAVVTANHDIIEFEASNGRISDWSRRNPSSCLSTAFKEILDRAMGCFWDSRRGCSRLWVYGATWLFMLDLSQDLPATQSTGKIGNHDVLEPRENLEKKRKRPLEENMITHRGNTGAGGDIIPSEINLGLGQHWQKFSGANQIEGKAIPALRPASPASDEDADTSSRTASLALMRRAADDAIGHDKANTHTKQTGLSGSGWKKSATGESPGSWLTFHYRYIYGIAPVMPMAADDEGQGRMEVVAIERPLYDVDMPPRFDGGQDWDTSVA